MKALFLNLPFPERLTRRYMCTYVSATSLFPPYELLSAAGALKGVSGVELSFLDCVAQDINEKSLLSFFDKLQPDVMLSLIGFESFEQDINQINMLKERSPGSLQVIFGHYPTIFAEEILLNSKADVIIKNEPDEVFKEIVLAISEKKGWEDVAGISYREDSQIIHTPPRGRISDLNQLPLPAYDLVDATKYFEPFMPSPFAMIQTSRGCPFTCNYCVTTYGSKFVSKSVETVTEELKTLKELHKIRSFRIIDDTFTVNKKFVVELCGRIIDEKLNLKWSCLSRADTLSEEVLFWMKKAGCERIYLGLESGSQRVLDFYKKKLDLAEATETLRQCNKIGIKTAGLFMTGLPSESREDFEQTIEFAVSSELTFAGIGELTVYPGTGLYDIYKDEVEFSLFPYVNHFKDKQLHDRSLKWRSEFHNRFYFRTESIINLSKIAMNDIHASFRVLKNMATASHYSTLLYPYINR